MGHLSIAILGGTGFIGTAIARRLVLRGLKPIAIARGNQAAALPSDAIFEAADRMDSASLSEIFERHDVNVVVDIFALGMLNTQAVFSALAGRGGRYVLLSSVDVYANYAGLLRREHPTILASPAKETDPLRTFRHPYRGNPHRPQGVDQDLFEDYDKIPLEEAARALCGIDHTIIRAPMIFGPGDKQHRFAWAIGAVQSGETIKLDQRAAAWPNSYGYVDDVAEAIVCAALHPAGIDETFNVGQPFVRTPLEWLHTFANLMEKKITIECVRPKSNGILRDRAEATDLSYPLTLDTSKIRKKLGFTEPTPELDALRYTIAAGG